MTANQQMFICCGGSGIANNSGSVNWSSGGYNGGGGLSTERLGSTGGGATHIATGTTNRGQLKNYSAYKSEVLIVAGAGGGGASWENAYTMGNTTIPAGYPYNGGYGGGLVGGSGTGASSNVDHIMTFHGGGQDGPGNGEIIYKNGVAKNSNGGFGYGGHGQGGVCIGTGGGAGWYGGTGSYDSGGGAGGSSYIGGVSNGSTIAGNASQIQPSGTTTAGHSGHGYARISLTRW